MSPEPETRWPRWVLRAADQTVVACVTALCLAALLLHWFYQQGYRGQLLEVERITPGTVPYAVDLNKADWMEFTVLPGVGETLAKRIVESREQQGPFRDLQDLSRVRGIGPRTLDRLRPYFLPLADLENTAEKRASQQPEPNL